MFASSDSQALGVLEAVRAAGLDVPGDMSVMGFDDVEVSGYAGLTTVRQPLFESGLAAGLLLDTVDAEHPPDARTHQLSIELVERSTTAPPPPARPRSRTRASAAGRTDRRPAEQEGKP